MISGLCQETSQKTISDCRKYAQLIEIEETE